MSQHAAIFRQTQARPHAGQALWADVLSVALVAWLGVHALRNFLAMIVWNLGEDRPALEMGGIALGVWVVGLLAAPAARLLGGQRPAWRLGLCFAAVYAGGQFVAHPLLTPLLGCLSVVLWLWALPALLTALYRQAAAGRLAQALLLGLAAQVAMQSALHGLDMPMLRGPAAGAGATALAALFAISLSLGSAHTYTRNHGHAQPGPWGWQLAALGPYLVLQLTLLLNLGRVQMLAGWPLPPAAALILAGLVLAWLALSLSPPRLVGASAGLAAIALLAWPGLLAGPGIWLLPLIQAGVSLAALSVSTPTAGRQSPGVYGPIVVAALLFFVLTFMYYVPYGQPALWPWMAALAVWPVLIPGLRERPEGRWACGAALVTVAVIGVALTLAGRPAVPPPAAAAPAELKILNYNIHQAFDNWSVPNPEGIARFIEGSDADIVGLQEVGRGWNLNGGVDLVSWLSRRLPGYAVVYGPMNGDLWGNVILSRYPVRESGWVQFPIRDSDFQRGLTWAVIPTTAGDLLFVTTHFSAYAGFDRDRTGQAEDLLAFWQGRPRTVITGDINATPGEQPVGILLAAGLVDAPAAHGLGEAFTYSAGQPYQRIDYIFTSPDVQSLGAAIPQTTASDHLPVEAWIRLD